MLNFLSDTTVLIFSPFCKDYQADFLGHLIKKAVGYCVYLYNEGNRTRLYKNYWLIAAANSSIKSIARRLA
jgi:hypothetical protein